MPTNPNPVVDPNGQALMNVLIEVGARPEGAYNATQGVRNMSGEQVIGRLDALEASTSARFDALEASTNARLDALEASVSALEASTSSRLDALEASVSALETSTSILAATTDARFNAIEAQLDIMGLAIMATFAVVAAMGGWKLFVGIQLWRRAEASATAAVPAGSEQQSGGGPE